MSDTLGIDYEFYFDVDSVLYDINTGLKDDCLYVVFQDESIFKKDDAYIEALRKSGKYIVLCYETRNKKVEDFCKKFSNFVVEFNKLDKYALLAYAEKMCKQNKCLVSEEKLLEIIDRCDESFGVLINELDKIFTLGQEKSDILVSYLLENGFPDYRHETVTDFVNCILTRDKKAFSMLERNEFAPVTVLFTIYNMSKQKLSYFRNPIYGKIMKICFELYKAITTDEISAEVALKYVTYKICFGDL